nr:MAG TPA: hypothetical protein [Caudoviricetes sp.]
MLPGQGASARRRWRTIAHRLPPAAPLRRAFPVWGGRSFCQFAQLIGQGRNGLHKDFRNGEDQLWLLVEDIPDLVLGIAAVGRCPPRSFVEARDGQRDDAVERAEGFGRTDRLPEVPALHLGKLVHSPQTEMDRARLARDDKFFHNGKRLRLRLFGRCKITATCDRITVSGIVAGGRGQREGGDVRPAGIHLRKTRQRRLDNHVDDLFTQHQSQHIFRGVRVLDAVVYDHQSVSVHRPRDVARSLLLAVGVFGTQLLQFEVDLQRVRRGMERGLFVYQEDDILALNDSFVAECFCHVVVLLTVIQCEM